METRIILSQIFILAVVVIIGIIGASVKVITSESKDMLSKVIFNISLPLMLFTNFLKLEATPKLLANSFVVLSVTGLVVFFLLLVGWVSSRVIGIQGREAAVFKAHSMFGNTIFLGFPLINALFGPEGLLYASMFQLISNVIMWTVGVIVLTYEKGTSWKKNLKKVINPNTIATLTGFTFFILSFKLPKLLLTPLSELGSANTWLSMLYIGAMLYLADTAGFFRKKSIFVLSFNRLILAPVILIFLFSLAAILMNSSPDKTVASVIILEASMPCMASVVIMARELGADDHLAVGNVFVSTILSILTLPVIMMLINRFL
ncbi:MAG TPA: AEC family transporter [Bacteroidales bacterium]|nr:AEC family transporter [Bacteroidales bacterium]